MLLFLTSINAEQVINVHIFVHGTRCSFLSLVSAVPLVKRALQDYHLYSKVVITSCDDDRFQDTQVMLDKGMLEIPRGMIDRCRNSRLDSNLSRKAAIQIINGYDYLNADKENIHRYYTYGWDGMLSDNYRKNDSLDMYKAIITLRDKLAKEYPNKKIVITMDGHSHGGNLIFYLAFHENKLKKDLVIDRVILYGTPIQPETAAYCLHPMFKKIINIYSEGDHIQVADKFSTASHTSDRRLGDFIDITNRPIIDVCVSAEEDRKAFSHASFFFIDMYDNGIGKARRHVFNELRYLPLVTLAPLFVDHIEKVYATSKQHHFNLNFSKENGTCTMSVETTDKRHSSKSQDLIPLIDPINYLIEKTWKPAAEHKGAMNLAKLAILDLMKVAPQHLLHPKTTAFIKNNKK